MESCGGVVEKSNRVLARSSVMLPSSTHTILSLLSSSELLDLILCEEPGDKCIETDKTKVNLSV